VKNVKAFLLNTHGQEWLGVTVLSFVHFHNSHFGVLSKASERQKMVYSRKGQKQSGEPDRILPVVAAVGWHPDAGKKSWREPLERSSVRIGAACALCSRMKLQCDRQSATGPCYRCAKNGLACEDRVESSKSKRSLSSDQRSDSSASMSPARDSKRRRH
jgi:Fungal Zn(2)-Cys(6) binuclear cluster domain